LALAAGCQSNGGVRATLDASTGITWTADPAPVVFARTEARYSRSARDYLYLGPVEVNRQGTRDYYLWIGIGTTLDRGYLAPTTPLPDKLYVDVGDEIIEFLLQPWRVLTPMASTELVYLTPVDLQATLGARVTSSQIEKLASELPRAVRVAIPGSASREYLRWEEGAVWPSFVELIESRGSGTLSGTAAARPRSNSAAN
jgi:hypothetical protein